MNVWEGEQLGGRAIRAASWRKRHLSRWEGRGGVLSAGWLRRVIVTVWRAWQWAGVGLSEDKDYCMVGMGNVGHFL